MIAPKRFARRVANLASSPEAWREHLEVVHDDDHVVYRGRVGAPARVVGLAIKSASDPSRRLTFEQAAATDFEFRVDVAELWRWCGQRRARYDLYLVVEGLAASPVDRRLGRFTATVTAEAMSGIVLPDDSDARAWTHVTELGNVSLRCFPEPAQQATLDQLHLTVGGSGMTATATLRTFNRPLASISGELVDHPGGQRRSFDVEATALDPTSRHGIHEYQVSFDVRPPAPTDRSREGMVVPHLLVDLAGAEDDPAQLPLKADATAKRFELDDIDVDAADDHVQVWVPTVTTRERRLVFWTETFTRSNHAYLTQLSRWGWLLVLRRPFAGVWLVGETPDRARGNGYHLFAWLRTHHPRRRAYYVVAADSPDYSKVEALGNVVVHRSREHLRHTLLASRFVGTHHSEFLHASRSRRLARRAGGVRILLQHGVTAMENVRAAYGRRTMRELSPDHVIVSSDVEKQIFVDHLDYRPRQVHVAGLARYDALLADAPAPGSTVLVVPTVDDPAWNEFLADPEVQRIQAATGCQLVVVGQDVDDDLLRSSAALLTDYSSTAWDAAFLGRPVAFLQPDLDQRLGARLPFVDSASMLPGPLCRTPAQLAAELVELAARDFAMEEQYSARAAVFLSTPRDGFCPRNHEVVTRAGGWRNRWYRILGHRRGREAFDRFAASDSYDRWMARVFAVGRLLPRKRTVMFETDRGRSFGASPRAIHDRLAEQHSALTLIWSANLTLRVPPGVRTLRRRTPRWFWELSRAAYWVSNQNAEVICPRPRRTFFLQTWHGTPLKKMQNDVPLMYGRQKTYHADTQKLVDDWSALVSPSEFATTAFRSAFGFDGPVLQAGTPGNDVFHRPEREERAELARRRLGLTDGRRVVLYAPTFRDDGRAFGGAGAWSHDMALDLTAFADRLGHDTTLLVRLHPLVSFSWPASLGPEVVNASKYPDVQDLLLVADVLVTDYSSIMFDFAQTGRPIVLFAYDLEHYRDTLRGFYADLEEVAPGPILTTSDEVIEAIACIDEQSPRFAERRAAFRDRFGSLEDGHAAQRVVDDVFRSRHEP